MNNPFYYGQIATGSDFTDREKELKELTSDLENGCRIFLISPRRYGKTSLAIKILEQLKHKNIFTAYLDLYDITNLEQFAAHYARAIARAYEPTTEKIIHFIRDMIPSLRPNITINPEGEISIGVETIPRKNELSLVIKNILEIPQKIADKKGTLFCVVLDEFQEIRTIGGEHLEKVMRATFQHQKNVGYLFAGSKQHIISDMILNKNKPFYKMGKVFSLGKIPENDLRKFILTKFKNSGKYIENKTLDEIFNVSEGIPYYALHLSHEMWNIFMERKNIPTDAVALSLEKITNNLSPILLSIWDSLTITQRHLLQAIAVSGQTNLFSRHFINIYGLGSSSSVEKSAKLLINKGILEKENGKYQFSDIWFREWIKKRAV